MLKEHLKSVEMTFLISENYLNKKSCRFPEAEIRKVKTQEISRSFEKMCDGAWKFQQDDKWIATIFSDEWIFWENL